MMESASHSPWLPSHKDEHEDSSVIDASLLRSQFDEKDLLDPYRIPCTCRSHYYRHTEHVHDDSGYRSHLYVTAVV
jgi:hypothetical protein